MVKNNVVSVEIPSALAEKLGKEAKKKGYKNLSEYVTHLLRESSPPEKGNSSLKPEEEKRIRERLRDLGYIE
jgi:Arc/MetJ-type ribon-helix-helix transcriptional regulator